MAEDKKVGRPATMANPETRSTTLEHYMWADLDKKAKKLGMKTPTLLRLMCNKENLNRKLIIKDGE